MAVSVRFKTDMVDVPADRPRSGDMVIVRRENGDMVRFEFDYDDHYIYVYTALLPARTADGYGLHTYGPVRRFTRAHVGPMSDSR
jgi:hypothetical protein